MQIENRVPLEKLRHEICALPSKQRGALLLNLRDGEGANAIALFSVTEI